MESSNPNSRCLSLSRTCFSWCKSCSVKLVRAILVLLMIIVCLKLTPLGCMVCMWWSKYDVELQQVHMSGVRGSDSDSDSDSSSSSSSSSSRGGGDWMSRVVPCPCTLEEAEKAGPDIWQRDTVPALHQPCIAVGIGKEEPGCTAHAFRSARSSVDGAGNQCCYGIDGHLITSGFSQGTVDRYSPIHDMILHSIHDVVPFFFCCHLCKEKDACNVYLKERRPLISEEGCLDRPSRGPS